MPREDSHYPLRPDTTSLHLLHIPKPPTRHCQRYDTIHSMLRNRSLELASHKRTSQLEPIGHPARGAVEASVSGSIVLGFLLGGQGLMLFLLIQVLGIWVSVVVWR